jgi:ribose/xylose/arabinose/galactoside ABC-type transport system permease subunit
MDFKAEWSSLLLIALMVVVAYFLHPGFGESPELMKVILQMVVFPIVVIALASIPVIIVCYFIKVIPDIDYSIRVGFLYMVFLLVWQFMA